MASYSGNEGVIYLSSGSVYEVTSAERLSSTVTLSLDSSVEFVQGNVVTVVGLTTTDPESDFYNVSGTYTLTGGDVGEASFEQSGVDTGAVAQTNAYLLDGNATLAEVMSFTIDQQMEIIDTTVMKSAWRTHRAGLKNWTATIECRWDDTNDAQEIAIGTQIFAALVPNDSDDAESSVLYGYGKITAVSQTQTFDNSTINRTITITGNGPQSLTYA